jgi:hypothetical protein
MRFFVTSTSLGKGGDLGGRAGADAHRLRWEEKHDGAALAPATLVAPPRGS